MDTLQELQGWYHSQCDGDWEHGFGVQIGTLDNPGWSVTINLVDTDLTEHPFTEVRRLEHETDWIFVVSATASGKGAADRLCLRRFFGLS